VRWYLEMPGVTLKPGHWLVTLQTVPGDYPRVTLPGILKGVLSSTTIHRTPKNWKLPEPGGEWVK
jgi:hypothetical protein